MSRSHAWQAATLAGLVTFLAACGGGTQTANSPQTASPIPDTAAIIGAVKKDPQLNANLPKAIAAKLGVTVQYQDMAFGSLITSLASGRVDLTMAGMNDTKARQQQIDFVDYFTSGITIMIRKGNPDSITGPDTLCGKNIAVVQGTSHQKFAAEQSTKCTQAGKQQINVTATDSDNQNQNQ